MEIIVIAGNSREYRDWHGLNHVDREKIPAHVVVGQPRMQPTREGSGNREHGVSVTGYVGTHQVYEHFIESPEHRDSTVPNRIGQMGAYVVDPIDQAVIDHWTQRATEAVRATA